MSASGKKGRSSRSKTNFRSSVTGDQSLWTGQLEKRSSGLIKKWQERHFELTGHYLNYFEGDDVRSAHDLNRLARVAAPSERELTLEFDDGASLMLRAETDAAAAELTSSLAQFLPSSADPSNTTALRKSSALGSLAFAKAGGPRTSSMALRGRGAPRGGGAPAGCPQFGPRVDAPVA